MEKHDRTNLAYTEKGLCLEGVPFREFIDRFSTPFYIYSENILLKNFQDFQNSAKTAGLDAVICFALKANANPHVLKSLAAYGAGADIVSIGELNLAIEAGISPNKIVFSGVGKTAKEIEQAIEREILSFNVESIAELELIAKLAEKAKKKANIAFRLNPKVHAKTHKHISTGFKTHKFGIIEKDILDSLSNKFIWQHCNLKGISVHIGSQLTCLEATKEAIKAACECAKKMPSLEFIDVGGGLGVSYKPDETPAPSVSEYMQAVSEVIQKYYPKKIKVIFEPGRRICASSGFFVTSVLRTKISEDCKFLIVDGGMNDFVRPSLYDAYHEIFPGIQGKELELTDIVGPICETADCFGQARMLPKLGEGDFIVIADTGAYGQTMSSTYNQRPPIREYFLNSHGKISP